MRPLIGVLIVVVLAGPTARAEGLSEQEQNAGRAGVAKRDEVGKLRAVEDYYRGIGKIDGPLFRTNPIEDTLPES
jgi:hypothetical protein